MASVEIMEEKTDKYKRDFVSVQHTVTQEGSETPSFQCWRKDPSHNCKYLVYAECICLAVYAVSKEGTFQDRDVFTESF